MTNSLTRSAARIYGSLSALGNGSTDVFERLLPFFEPILRTQQAKQFDPSTFAASVREVLKWNFNTDVVEVFVPHMVEAGWLSPDDPGVEPTTYTVTLPEQIIGIEVEATANAELRALAEEFKAFSEALSPLTTLPKVVEEFEDVLIEWLLYIEAFSERNLDFKSRTLTDETGTLRQVVDVPRTTSLSSEEKFLCARFVEETIKSSPEKGETLARIASIGLLTEVVQDFVKPNTPIETSNLVVYLDAPVAMELLGVSGRAARENTEPVIAELQRIGATVRVFGQSLDEIKRTLRSVLQNPRPTGPTAQALARNEVLKDYVARVAADPEPFLKEHNIGVTYRTLEQVPSEHQYFTDEQRTEIYGSLTFQQKSDAREHDADVTTLIMRLRRGQQDRDVFRSRFVLITRNGLLAQLARKRCIDLGVLSPKSTPPVVHRRFMTTSMWLRTGLGSQDLEVPKRMLLATCERVLAIRPGVVEAVKKLTDALGDSERVRQLDLLISQPRSTQILMDKTLGAPGVVTDENLSELFQQMLHPHLEEERARGQEAVKEARRKGRERLQEANQALQVAQASETATTQQLLAKLREDKLLVEALCRELTDALSTKRRRNRIFGGVIAIVLCLPVLLGSQVWGAAIAFVLAIPLAYLTVTGSRFIGTTTSERAAIDLLEKTAEQRRMGAKLALFDVRWLGAEYSVMEQSTEVEASVTQLI